MKAKLLITLTIALSAGSLKAQDIKESKVPAIVRSALAKKYPEASKVSWEKERTNYEANWGGRSGEDNSVQFTPSGAFVEIVRAISITELPKTIATYIKDHYRGKKIREAGEVTDAGGKTTYEVEITGADLIFDKGGTYLKKD